MDIFVIVLIITLIVLAWIYSIYASLIQKRNKVQEAFSSIDVQLEKRYDLIPNILAIAQKYMEHERYILEEITALRSQAKKLGKSYKNINKKIELDNQIAQRMGEFNIAVENYPELKADHTMIIAMQTYNEIEEHIAAARRFYNSATLELKNAVEIFPSSLFAVILNIKAANFFEATPSKRKAVNASDYLK